MHSVGSVPLLTRTEELTLAQRLERARIQRRLAVWIAPWRTPVLLDHLGEDARHAAVIEDARGRLRTLAGRWARSERGDEIQDALFEEEEALPVERERVDALADRLRDHRLSGTGTGLTAHQLDVVLQAIERAEADAEARRNELVAANLRLVIYVAIRYRDMGLPLSDLLQEGNLGLMHGVGKFDHRRGHRLSTYVTWWIRQSVTRALSDQSRTVRIPIQTLDRFSRVRKARQAFVQERGRRPTEAELARRLDLTEAEVRELTRPIQTSVSLETPLGDDDDGRLGDLLADPAMRDPAEATEVQDLQVRAHRALASLPPRERLVLEMRYGIGQPGGKTLAEVGQQIEVTRERVRQIQHEALERLRRRGMLDDLSEFLEE
jgi:RNA polymerase primary sigma factor